MDLNVSADQELLAETTRRFLERECPITEVRRLHDEAVDGFDREYWRKGCELGWTAMLVPEADGGGSVSGDGLLDLVLVAEEMGRLVSPGPLVPVNVVADALARRGTDAQRAAVLPDLVSGDAIATWAFAESNDSWDAAGVTLTAVADWFLVTARTGEGLTQFLVPADTTGVTVTRLGTLDLTRQFGSIAFEQTTVSGDAVVGEVGGAAGDVERQLEVALVLHDAETVGATDVVFNFTLEYAKDRIAFGRPIGSYQALKHRFADMRTWLEGCHATATASARAVQAGDDDAAELVSVAKSYIADRCPSIIQDCVQLHGGIGVTWEHDLHLYLRRVAQNAALYGSVEQHRERLAVLIGM